MKLEPGEHVAGKTRCARCGKAFDLDTRRLSDLDPPPDFWTRYVRDVLEGLREAWCPPCTALIEEEQDRLDEEDDKTLRARRLERSDIPEPLRREFTEIDRKSEAVQGAIWEWGSGERDGLLLYGEVGVGKTFLAGVAASARCSRSQVRWVSVPALLSGLRAGYGTREQAWAAHVFTLEYGQRPALVLDDLDKSRPTEAAMEPLFLAVDRWTAEELPLLVTMNRPLDRIDADWPEAFSGPIASRLNGYCGMVEILGPDRRAE